MSVRLCFIRQEYFETHNDFVKMLDVGNASKQSQRTHLCLVVERNSNSFFIPLRNNLGDPIRKYGRIGHSVPSEKRARAGLDFRYTLVVNDNSSVEEVSERKITKRQLKLIESDYMKICNEFETYLNGYIKAAKRGKADRIPLYRESSLVNFHRELGI